MVCGKGGVVGGACGQEGGLGMPPVRSSYWLFARWGGRFWGRDGKVGFR